MNESNIRLWKIPLIFPLLIHRIYDMSRIITVSPNKYCIAEGRNNRYFHLIGIKHPIIWCVTVKENKCEIPTKYRLH